ncbi:MAG: hypothetical protein FWG40_00595 [Peptococcaceae bacterium]|nr:hypothetical protein [Peptococcaceae bacterium]
MPATNFDFDIAIDDEDLLFEIEMDVGEGGTNDYDQLKNKPKINNVTLVGNRDLPETPLTNMDIAKLFGII